MKKTIGYFDIHLHGADPVKGITAESIIADANNPNIVTRLFGDIVDCKNAVKKLVEAAQKLKRKLQSLLGDKYKTGNHEVDQDEDIPTLVNGWLCCHSDMIYNGLIESKKDRMVTPGAGKFSRFLKGSASKARDAGLINLHGKMDDPEVQARFLEYCARYGGTKGVIGGHKHPSEKLTAEINGLKFVIYPRGRHEVTELAE